ncbi:unnamed protein product, partial [Rotaria sp. Silwood1]
MKAVPVLDDDLYQNLSFYRDVHKLTQIGLDTTQFLQWLDMENIACASLLHLIPAYFEYQINTYLDYDKADFNLLDTA